MLLAVDTSAQQDEKRLVTNAAFTFKVDRYGIADLSKTGDVHPTSYIRKGQVFGEVTIRYTHNGKLDSLKASTQSNTVVTQDGKTVSSWLPQRQSDKILQLSQSFSLSNNALTWDITLENTSGNTIGIEDLVLPLFYNNGGGENPKEIFEQRAILLPYVVTAGCYFPFLLSYK